MGYLTNFIVYTLAMVGVIVIALMVFKGSTGVRLVFHTKLFSLLSPMLFSGIRIPVRVRIDVLPVC